MSKAFVITNPMIAANRSAEVTLSKFLRVISAEYRELAVIGGNISLEHDLAYVTQISRPMNRAENKAKRLVDIVFLQFWMAGKVLKSVKKRDAVFFWIGDKMLMPYIAAKLLGAQINYFIYGNVGKEGCAGRFQHISEKLIRWLAEHADYVCMESPSVEQEWPNLKSPNKRIIHLYTEPGEVVPVSSRKNTMGMICRLTPGKHIMEAIEAMQIFHRKYPAWTLEIVGSGKQEQACMAKIEEMGASSYIRMLGWQEHKAMFTLMKNWKFLLYPTDTEGLPNGVIEAMARGIPAIASPVGGLRDLIADGVNGYLLPGVSSVDIFEGMDRAVMQADAEQVCSAAYHTIQAEYTLSGARKRAGNELKGN